MMDDKAHDSKSKEDATPSRRWARFGLATLCLILGAGAYLGWLPGQVAWRASAEAEQLRLRDIAALAEARSLSRAFEDQQTRALPQRFAALASRYKDRGKALGVELAATRGLGPEAREEKILEANRAYRRDTDAIDEEVRKLIRTHPAEPAAFEGVVLLVDTMSSFLDEDLVRIVRDHFLDDPRMSRLCEPLAQRWEDWAGDLLRDVSARHPDRVVRGRAAFALAKLNCTASMGKVGEVTSEAREVRLAEARTWFQKVAVEFADLTSADGKHRLADEARAELARLDKLAHLKIGMAAPEITGEDLDGRVMRLSDHRGKVVVLTFWGSWCGPCMAMVPQERELVERMRGKPFALLGVDSEGAGGREKGREAARENRMSWPSWWDGEDGAIGAAYGIDHLPTIYVLDPRGVIRFCDVRGERLDRAVAELMKELDGDSKIGAGR